MSKLNLRLLVGLALGVNIFSYIGVRSINWLWMHQNNFVNSYLGYLGYGSFGIETLIYFVLPYFLPIVLLVLALVFAQQKKIALIFIASSLLSRVLGFFLAIVFPMVSTSYEWPFSQAIETAVKSYIFGISNFTLLLDTFSVVVKVTSHLSLVLVAIFIVMRLKREKVSAPQHPIQ